MSITNTVELVSLDRSEEACAEARWREAVDESERLRAELAEARKRLNQMANWCGEFKPP